MIISTLIKSSAVEFKMRGKWFNLFFPEILSHGSQIFIESLQLPCPRSGGDNKVPAGPDLGGWGQSGSLTAVSSRAARLLVPSVTSYAVSTLECYLALPGSSASADALGF